MTYQPHYIHYSHAAGRCRCHPDKWMGKAPLICSEFEGDGDACERCLHDAECHPKTKE